MEEPANATRPATDWGRAADGIGLAGFALFLLLNTTGALPWSFWLDALSLWPVLLMSAGVKIAFERTRMPWLVLLGPALVLGALAWLASGARPAGPVGPWEAESVSRPEGTQRVELDAKLVGARLRDRVVGRPAGRSRPRRPLRLGRARVAAGGLGERRVWRRSASTAAGATLSSSCRAPRSAGSCNLPAELPLRVRLNGAGIGGELDLARGALEGALVDGVFLGVEARLPGARLATPSCS